MRPAASSCPPGRAAAAAENGSRSATRPRAFPERPHGTTATSGSGASSRSRHCASWLVSVSTHDPRTRSAYIALQVGTGWAAASMFDRKERGGFFLLKQEAAAENARVRDEGRFAPTSDAAAVTPDPARGGHNHRTGYRSNALVTRECSGQPSESLTMNRAIA